MRISRRSSIMSAASLALAAPAVAQGAWRPTRPVRLIVPWLAGTSSDVPLRVMAEIASRQLGQPVVVENRTGATGTIGPQMMAQEPRGDGHMIGQIPVTAFRIPAMVSRPPFNPLTDFTYIIHMSGFLFGVVVRADSPWQTWEQFLEHARRNPGRVTYGTPGVGSTLHIGMERIGQHYGIQFEHVPFRGGNDTTQALLSRQIDSVADSTGWAPQVEDGSFRLLVQWGAERTPRFRDVRTLRETGFDMVSDSPWGIAGPRGMEPAVVQALHDALRVALHDPATVAALGRFDMPVRYMNSEDYANFARRLNEEETATVRRMGLRMD